MTDRIRTDNTIDEPRGGYIEEPAIIVHRTNGDNFQYIIQVAVVDPQADNPALFGILMSDLLDHIAGAYRDCTGRDERDIRAQLFKAMRDEDRFKEKDPSRGNPRGKTFLGKRQ